MEGLTLIDTCVLLDFMLGKDMAIVSRVEGLLLESRAAISVVTIFELLRGVESEKHLLRKLNGRVAAPY